MSNLPEQSINRREEADTINIGKLVTKLTDKWHWFLIAAIICLFAAFLYNHYTPPTYQIRAKLLVNDDEKGGGLGKQAGALMDLGGILGSKSSVDNEAEILKTEFLMQQVVRELQLNIIYSRKLNPVNREIENPPFRLNIIKGVDTIENTHIKIEQVAADKLKVSTKDFTEVVAWNQRFKIDNVGTIELIPSPGMLLGKTAYDVEVMSIDERVATLLEDLSVGTTNKQVTIIDMGLVYPLQAKGEMILRTLINRYTATNLSDKNAIADSSYKFIRERINAISLELGDVEDKVENFKQKNRLADMSEQSKLLVQNTGEFTSELAKAETQVSVLNDLESYLKDETKNKRVFPTSLLPQDMVFSGLMAQYNTLLVERDRQLLSVKEGSPFIENIDTQISGLRNGILGNIQSTKNTYILTRNKLRSQLSTADNQIGDVPQIEKNYLKLARNQQIKQELYIFLMQKAEETAISKTSNIAVAKVINPPKAQVKPISPRKGVIYVIALVLSAVITTVIIFGRELFNTAVLTKEDILEATTIPVIGEISHNLMKDNLIVATQGRSAISEQFRALRTNLSFYLKNHNEKVILLTSSMSGEGKSFTAINLGFIMAMTGKKVLLMELDLRKPGLSAKFNMPNTNGFSNYTINTDLLPADIIQKLPMTENMFLISSGPLPPNPAETLMSERTGLLIELLKQDFDYIIMDAPPIGIITDAQLLAPFADATIYLVRQRVTQKTQLDIAQEMYNSGKMKNMGIVVNDISSKQYGYGYGYGNYGEVKEQNWFKKFAARFKNN
jgi:tyrosine-protein kinase Etk/Wzc